MIKLLIKLAKDLIRPINSHAPALMGTLALVWGGWVANPKVDTFGSAALFSKMEAFAPETTWGLWALALGILVIYSTIKQNFVMMYTTLMLEAWLWGITALFMWLGDWSNTGGIVYTYISLHTAWLYLNVKINYAKDTRFD